MDNKVYKTRQRENLLSFFKENKDKCFAAKDIIKNPDINLGEATIYRTLSDFASRGVLKKFISPGTEGAYYQYNECSDKCSSHFHLKCTKCGALYHMDCSFMLDMAGHIKEKHGFSVDNSQTTLYGICKNCG